MISSFLRRLVAALQRSRARPPAPVRVSFYGDSITSGATQGGVLNPTPVQRMTEMSRGIFVGVDYSLSGTTVQDAVAGTPGMPFGPWAQQIVLDASPVVVIRYVTAGALRFADRIGEYESLLTTMVTSAQARGKKVVLTGAPWIAAPMPGLTPAESQAVLASVTQFDVSSKMVAVRTGAVFVDLRTVLFSGTQDMADNVHPNQGYSDRLSAFLAAKLCAVVST